MRLGRRVAVWIAAVVLLVATAPAATAKRKYRVPPFDEATGKFRYRQEIAVDGTPAAELYRRAKAFVARTCSYSQEATAPGDSGFGKLRALGSFPIAIAGARQRVWHTFAIEVWGGGYRVTLGDLRWRQSDGPPVGDLRGWWGYRRALQSVADQCEALLAGLKTAMLQPATPSSPPAVPAGGVPTPGPPTTPVPAVACRLFQAELFGGGDRI